MLKNLLFAAFFTFLCFSFSSAQTSKKSADTNWEILEVSHRIYTADSSNIGRYNRKFTYHTSGVSFDASDSLEWMKESNWELVSVYGYEGGSSLFFKRIYNKQRTEKEIERLKKDFGKDSIVSTNTGLVDLDLVEYDQKAKDLAQSEKAKYENLLKQIRGVSMQIISVETTSYDPKSSNIAAEIVLDATALLVKNGKSYRSSEAEKYYRETTKEIIENLNLQHNGSLNGDSLNLSNGKRKPEKIGGFKNFYGKVSLKISVIVNLNGQQNTVSQGFIYAQLKKDNE